MKHFRLWASTLLLAVLAALHLLFAAPEGTGTGPASGPAPAGTATDPADHNPALGAAAFGSLVVPPMATPPARATSAATQP